MNLLSLNQDILPPSDDYIFKAIMTHPNAKIALMDLISAVIGRTVIDVEIRNNELPVTDNSEKNERLDVNCVIDNGDQVNVEMQGSRIEEILGDHQNFINKTIYYLTDLHSSQKSKGIAYHNLVRTYQITFCMYTIFPHHKDYVGQFNMRRADGELLSDQINAIIIELSKLGELLTKPIEEMNSLEMWSAFLRYAPEVKYRKLVNELIKHKEAIAVAGQVLSSISQDEHERAKLLSRRKYETDIQSNLITAELRGEARGEMRGVDKGMEVSAMIIGALLRHEAVEDIAARYQVSVERVRLFKTALHG